MIALTWFVSLQNVLVHIHSRPPFWFASRFSSRSLRASHVTRVEIRAWVPSLLSWMFLNGKAKVFFIISQRNKTELSNGYSIFFQPPYPHLNIMWMWYRFLSVFSVHRFRKIYMKLMRIKLFTIFLNRGSMGKEEAYQRAANKYQITKKIFIFHIYFRNNLQSILITF